MFEHRLAAVAALIAARLDAAMAPMGDLPVVQAMRYASGGGKRLRGFLVIEGAALHGLELDGALDAAAADNLPIIESKTPLKFSGVLRLTIVKRLPVMEQLHLMRCSSHANRGSTQPRVHAWQLSDNSIIATDSFEV